MNKRLKAVVIGAAHVHILEHCQYCNENQDIDLIAVADPEPVLKSDLTGTAPYTRRWNLEYIKQYGLKIYQKYTEMLDDVRPDIAIITTENTKHLDIYKECAIRGIDVSIEKPLACSLEEALIMAKLSEKNHSMLMTNWPILCRAWLYQMKQVLHSGRIGNMIKMRYLAGLTGIVGPGTKHRGTNDTVALPMNALEKGKMWWYNAECGGGALFDMCCYGGMMSAWMNKNEAISVMAMSGNFNSRWGNVEDNAVLMLRYPESISILEGTWTTPPTAFDPGPEIYGSEGVIRCFRKDMLVYVKVIDLYGKEEVLEPITLPIHMENIESAYVHHKITGEPMPEMTLLNNNLKVVAMLDAGRRSIGSGKAEQINI